MSLQLADRDDVANSRVARLSAAMKTAPSLQVVDNLGMAISLVASTRGVTLLPADAKNFLPWSVTSLPLAGAAKARGAG